MIASMSASTCDGREHYTLFSALKPEINSSDVIPDLRNWWKQLRFEQPQIATTIEDMKRIYTIPSEESLEK
jgi:hypothetical protein